MVAPEVCDFMGRVGLQLQARHWSTADIVVLFADTGSEVSKPTPERYYRAIRLGTAPLSAEKATGRRVRLTPREKAILAGLFSVREAMDENRRCRPVFLITLGDSVAQHYLDDYHVSWVPVVARICAQKTISLLKHLMHSSASVQVGFCQCIHQNCGKLMQSLTLCICSA